MYVFNKIPRCFVYALVMDHMLVFPPNSCVE